VAEPDHVYTAYMERKHPKEIMPDLDSTNPDSYLAPAKAREENSELRRKFFDKKDLKHVTESEVWKILATAKTILVIKCIIMFR
jgi:hypothetical protein